MSDGLHLAASIRARPAGLMRPIAFISTLLARTCLLSCIGNRLAIKGG
jgi:hypothetical protein